MTVEGPRKGEPSTNPMQYGLRTQPAPLVRGSSRRIMSMRFRPANISVINRRDSSEAVIGPAVQNPCSKLTSGIMFPLRRPSKPFYVPERCSPSRVHSAAPNYGAPLTAAPFRPTGFATGGSGGNMTQIPWNQKPKPRPLKRLDRSLHIRVWKQRSIFPSKLERSAFVRVCHGPIAVLQGKTFIRDQVPEPYPTPFEHWNSCVSIGTARLEYGVSNPEPQPG